MPEIMIADNHEQVYPIWESRNLQGISLTHLDFHCDMRGIMIDRPAGKAFFTSEREKQFIDRGNFLAHAIMNGIVSDLRWIHGPRGGRKFDIGPVVSYETDFKAPLHRRFHRQSGGREVSFRFSEKLLTNWQGPQENEYLDLDWDAFASVEYDAKHRDELVGQFFERDFSHIPELTTLIYSPGYSDPDRSLFKSFAERLGDRFNANLVWVPPAPLNTQGESRNPVKKLLKKVAPPQIRAAKRMVSRTYRKIESARDLETV
jgi:hypothetical protein